MFIIANYYDPDHNDSPLPDISVDTLLNTRPLKFSPESDTLTISVDVMTIQKTTATTLTKDPNVFYDTEVLAIIYRSKSKSTGLVSTKMWSWQGKRSQLGEKELSKLQELAKRYGTNLVDILQSTSLKARPNYDHTGNRASVPGATTATSTFG